MNIFLTMSIQKCVLVTIVAFIDYKDVDLILITHHQECDQMPRRRGTADQVNLNEVRTRSNETRQLIMYDSLCRMDIVAREAHLPKPQIKLINMNETLFAFYGYNSGMCLARSHKRLADGPVMRSGRLLRHYEPPHYAASSCDWYGNRQPTFNV